MLTRTEKMKRMAGNFVGVTASVAVVATVASFSISVEAAFLDVTVFQNRAFYELEVNEIVEVVGSGEIPEEAPEPINTPVRLRVQNQWDDFFLPLIYGYNQGFIEPLRPNQQYTLSIEIEQTLGWSTLDTYLFNTQPTNAAVISEVLETTSPLDPITHLDVSVFTQNGGTPPTDWQLELRYGDTVINEPLVVGENQLRFENIDHVNAPIELSVVALFETSSEIFATRTVEPTIFVDGDITLAFPSLTTLAIHTRKTVSLPGATFQFKMTEEGQLSTTQNGENDLVEFTNLNQGQAYFFEWIIRYQDSLNAFKDVVLFSQTITPILTPIYVISVYDQDNGQVLEVTIDRDVEIETLSIQGEQNGNLFNLPFTLVQETNNALTYRLETDFMFNTGVAFALVLMQPAPLDYPITLQTIVFQQGGTIV